MKTVLTYRFNLNEEEDQYSYEEHVKALKNFRSLTSALDDFKNFLRSNIKHNDKLKEDEYKAYEDIRTKFFELLSDYEVDIE